MRKKKASPKRVMEELAAIGFARATDYLCVREDELVLRSTDTLSDEAGAAIATIEQTKSGIKLKFYDKLKALELLGKHFGIFDGSGDQPKKQGNLLEAIRQSTCEEMNTDDIPELQQAAESCHDLVEPSEAQGS